MSNVTECYATGMILKGGVIMFLSKQLCLCTVLMSVTMTCIAEVPMRIHTERTLDADGPKQGQSAYDLIRAFGGSNPIESPDLYPENHPSHSHIFEETDDQVGHHFKFVLHRDKDRDRDKLNITDRQRNEIKAYGGSEKALKAYQGETFEYRWKFKLDGDFAVSKHFTHVFQLKSVDDGPGSPIFAFTARKRYGEDVLEVGHAPIKRAHVIASHTLADIRGEWLSVVFRVTYANVGQASVSVKRLRDGKSIIELAPTNIDTWRGTEPEHFVRPKWGIYRSLKDIERLRAGEESARFANFVVRELR
ncbi:hypothetical protein EOL70_03060 [Leucothrix sargassi]|nr:hypothetical protein EOL70_03060 [Leucothrix sargassi]